MIWYSTVDGLVSWDVGDRMVSLLARPLIPLASPEDATETYEAFRPYLLETDTRPIAVHVIEKAGGAPDKAPLGKRQEYADELFEAFETRAGTDGIAVETEVLYGTDVADTILEASENFEATAIVFRSRGTSRWMDRLTGNVRSSIISGHEIPALLLPDIEHSGD